jgi:O-antigen/teichoic acid export membrane protein
MKSLRHQTAIGILWSLAEQFAVKGISVLTTLILAWFLVPEDFGLVAMMAVFISIANCLTDSGLKQALIRLPQARPIDYNTAFFTNLTLGVVSYGVLYISAPWIADFYEEPRLIQLIRVMGLVILVNAFQLVQLAVISRNLDFKTQFWAVMPSAVISAITAIVLAYRGFGVWSLVFQSLVSALGVNFFLWVLGRWQPRMQLSLKSLKGMIGFGSRLLLAQLSDIVFRNMYIVVIAKGLSTGVAGLYFFAERVRDMSIFMIVSSIQKVTYPALSSIQDDSPRVKEGYRQLLIVSSFIILPLILILAALSEPLFVLIIPERWLPASGYLQLMLIAGIFMPLNAMNINILTVYGRSDIILLLEVIKKGMAVTILVVSFRFGVIGILLGQILSSFLAFIPNAYYVNKIAGISLRDQTACFLPYLLLATFVGGTVWAMQHVLAWDPKIKILILGSGGIAGYILLTKMSKLNAVSMALNLLVHRRQKTL